MSESKPEDNIENKSENLNENSSETENAKESGNNEGENKNDGEGLHIGVDSSSGQEAIVNYLKQFEGKTIVDIEYEGASSYTLPTVKVAATQHVGDEFTTDSAIKDMEIFLNTGYS